MSEVDHIFTGSIRPAVAEMRKAGMTEAAIAGAVCDIRAAAIQEERLRVEFLVRAHPPKHPTWVQMMELLTP